MRWDNYSRFSVRMITAPYVSVPTVVRTMEPTAAMMTAVAIADHLQVRSDQWIMTRI
ncbi:MAG: hypothetical protein QUS14_11710 [Pyrinomonadaceae bacterium]|nr:hypothetical protein [Pyrinomonadaceae bacterium]